MRRPVGVKAILFLVCETSLFSCRGATVAMLPFALSRSELFARCRLGVLGSAGAAICLAPCGSTLMRVEPGPGDRRSHRNSALACVFPLPGTVLTLVLFTQQLQRPRGCWCATCRRLLRSPTDDAATPPAFSPSQ